MIGRSQQAENSRFPLISVFVWSPITYASVPTFRDRAEQMASTECYDSSSTFAGKLAGSLSDSTERQASRNEMDSCPLGDM